MKENQFRIGNYLQDAKGRLCEIVFLQEDTPSTNGEELWKACAVKGGMTNYPVNAILITDECLVKLGFELKTKALGYKYDAFIIDDVWYISHGGDQTELREFGRRVSINETMHWVPTALVMVKYVHQLQNLFFALTGKELTCG